MDETFPMELKTLKKLLCEQKMLETLQLGSLYSFQGVVSALLESVSSGDYPVHTRNQETHPFHAHVSFFSGLI